jgi:two-component system, NtrC family, sensor kinase
MVWNFTLYLLYGLAFFTLGVSILSRDLRLSELGIAKILWLLSAFGISHAFHEWNELLAQLVPKIITPGFTLFSLTLAGISFLFLLYFGIFLLIITFAGDKALKTTPMVIKTLVGALALFLVLFTVYFDHSSGKDIHIRLFIAIPGGLLSGIGLMMYSGTVESFSKKVAMKFVMAGCFMIFYAFATGAVPSYVVVPYLDVKIVLFRGLCAFFITYFTIKALAVFSLEQREIINDKLLRFSQSEKMASLGILAAGIAHEINNPLTNVSLNVELLKDQIGDNERALKKLAAIERNAERASKIAKELLHFSREKETALEATDINRIIIGCQKLLKNHELSSIIHYTLREVPQIKAIPWKIEEVIINLLMNSLDACTGEDFIEIETLFRNNKVMVLVSDSGKGISERDLAKVFDPFFTTKEIGKGTGLGLSVCYNILKNHGGEISIQSSQPGGTVVSISLPVISDE